MQRNREKWCKTLVSSTRRTVNAKRFLKENLYAQKDKEDCILIVEAKQLELFTSIFIHTLHTQEYIISLTFHVC